MHEPQLHRSLEIRRGQAVLWRVLAGRVREAATDTVRVKTWPRDGARSEQSNREKETHEVTEQVTASAEMSDGDVLTLARMALQTRMYIWAKRVPTFPAGEVVEMNNALDALQAKYVPAAERPSGKNRGGRK